jgi:pyruvate dehydrogenase E2 component (dihydrolipoamide acetyltransferase)
VTKRRDVTLPDIGDFSDVEIIEILVTPGDRIEPEQSLLTLESDKATMEIPAPFGGKVAELGVAVGDKVNKGDLLMTLEGEDTGATEEPPAAGAQAAAPAGAADAASAPAPEAPPSARAGAERETVEVRLPDIGDFGEVPVIEVLVGPGDRIEIDQSMVTLESDKATMEIPSPRAGEVQSVAVKVGDRLSQGDLVLTLLTEPAAQGAEESEAESAEEAEVVQAPASVPKPEAETPGRFPGEAERRKAPVLPRPEDMAAIAKGRKPHASPAVRRFARELGVDLTLVKGSGPKGRILKDDVQGYVKQALAMGAAEPAGAALPFPLPAAPEIDYAKFGEVEVAEVPRIKKISGRHLHRCWISVPHVTQFDEADITELEAFRKSQKAAAESEGVRLTFLPFLLKAVAKALDTMPNLKASLTGDGERLVYKHFTHIGVAVDTPNGLLVPVIRDVDQKGVYDLARELMTTSQKARAGKLLPGDMQGGCFSVSSLGGIGGTAFTPIVNAPEAAILGVSRSEMKPVWNGSEFTPRLMLPLSLSYDHRIVDGAEGVRFTSLLRELLGDIRRLLL